METWDRHQGKWTACGRTAEHEHVEIERTAVGKQVNKPPQVREEGDTLIISSVEEIVVVEAASSFERGGSRPSNKRKATIPGTGSRP